MFIKYIAYYVLLSSIKTCAPHLCPNPFTVVHLRKGVHLRKFRGGLFYYSFFYSLYLKVDYYIIININDNDRSRDNSLWCTHHTRYTRLDNPPTASSVENKFTFRRTIQVFNKESYKCPMFL
ncbi:hypothetical protein QTP88_014984 [Uroleucon formosanum]